MAAKTKAFATSIVVVAFTVIVSIATALFYGSTNAQYLAVRSYHSLLTWKYRVIHDVHRPTLTAEYRAFEDIIKLKPWPEVDPQLEPSKVIEELRVSFTMANLVPKPSNCRINDKTFTHQGHRVKTFWVNHHHKRILIYLHGGAYALGDIHSYAGLECHLSRLFNMTVLHVEYRLSPEHPLSAAVEDTIALYRSLLQHNYSSSQIFFMGDSAGGGLTLLTIQSLISDKIDVPRGAVVLSPWTDLSASGESYQRNRAKDVMFTNSDSSDDSVIKLLLGENPSNWSAAHPRVSPLFGSFKDFPPLFIAVGTAEVLEDDGRRVSKKAEADRVEVTFEEGEHLMHVYPLFYPYFPEARRTLANIRRWIEHRGRGEGSDTSL